MNLKLTLNFDRLFEVKYWLPTLKQNKQLIEKRLVFTGQKIRLLAFHTASLEPGTRWLKNIDNKNSKEKHDSFWRPRLLKIQNLALLTPQSKAVNILTMLNFRLFT
jgi:hypothetical protein